MVVLRGQSNPCLRSGVSHLALKIKSMFSDLQIGCLQIPHLRRMICLPLRMQIGLMVLSQLAEHLQAKDIGCAKVLPARNKKSAANCHSSLENLQGIGISSISSAHDPNATAKVSKSASSPLVRQGIQVSVRNAPNCIFCAFSFFGAVIPQVSILTRTRSLCASWLQGTYP